MDEYICDINFIRNCDLFFNPHKLNEFILKDNSIVYVNAHHMNLFIDVLHKFENVKNIKIVSKIGLDRFEDTISSSERLDYILSRVDEIITDNTAIKHKKIKMYPKYEYFRIEKLLNCKFYNGEKIDEVFTCMGMSEVPETRILYDRMNTFWETNSSFEDYMYEMSKYKYLLCPHHLMNTIRFYEAIFAGCIPITFLPYENDLFKNISYINIPETKNINIISKYNIKSFNPPYIVNDVGNNSQELLKMPNEWKNYKVSVQDAIELIKLIINCFIYF